MTDIKDQDEEITRPSKPSVSSDEDDTRPNRPIEDFQSTVRSVRPRSSAAPPPSTWARTTRAGSQATGSRQGQTTVQRSKRLNPPPGRATVISTPQPNSGAVGKTWRWFVRGLLLVSLLTILIGVLALSGSVITYFWIARQLPPAEELRSLSFQFKTTQILDREGNLLWEIIDPTGGRRTTVFLNQVSPDLINATIATEDRFFYLNVGVDPIAIARAVYYNVTEGQIVSGASTITQQLARNILLSPEERTQQSLSRKVREAILAVEINRRYTKQQILEIYLNQIYYGNLAYGIEAASQTYFGKPASELTLAEAALLAGLPQSPATHDPYVNPTGAKARQEDVLRLMVEAGYINAAQAEAAKRQELALRELSAAFDAPHFVTYVRQELESIVPPEYIYQAGLRVQTTLEPRLQAIAEEEVRNQVNALANRNTNNGALVAMNVTNGEILAMVGSKDFRDEQIDGQINMAISPRQPGSTMKPLTYLAAFELLDWTPSTLMMDVPVQYPDNAGNIYEPTNYDQEFHGPISLRNALANSYNIPPVRAQAAIGTNALKEIAARLGITSLDRDDYGLSLTLGSGEIPLIEMTGAYQAMANKGILVPPTSILRITDGFGRVIEPGRPQPRRALREEHAYLMTNILADNEARSIAFGPNSSLRLSRPAAAKTGTTNDFRDSWAIGYTPDIVTGVWVGNADRTPMFEVSGLTGAGPIWHNFMERAHEGLQVRDFTRPPAIIELEVCADSGTIPSEVCPERRKEIFFQGQPPLGPDHDMHQLIEIDLGTGLRANDFCRTYVEERYYRVFPPEGRAWALEQGIEQPPEAYCPSTNIVATISQPLDGSTVRGRFNLEGSAVAANFSHYQIEVGQGTDPRTFSRIYGPINQLIEQGILGTFDATQVDNGPYTLRLMVFDQNGGAVEARVRVLVVNPISTPTSSPTSTLTPTPTVLLPTATSTLAPSATPTMIPTNTPTAVPTATPTVELPTLTPIPLPTELPPESPTDTPAAPPTSPVDPTGIPAPPLVTPSGTITSTVTS